MIVLTNVVGGGLGMGEGGGGRGEELEGIPEQLVYCKVFHFLQNIVLKNWRRK